RPHGVPCSGLTLLQPRIPDLRPFPRRGTRGCWAAISTWHRDVRFDGKFWEYSGRFEVTRLTQLRHCRIEIPQCKRYASNGVLPTLQVDRPQRWSQARVHRARVRSVRRAPLAYCPTSSASHASCQHLVDTTAIKIDDLKAPALIIEGLTCLGQMAEAIQCESSSSMKSAFRRKRDVQPVRHLVGGHATRDQP